jgi:hypothetical protein
MIPPELPFSTAASVCLYTDLIALPLRGPGPAEKPVDCRLPSLRI